jgi:triphosphatase
MQDPREIELKLEILPADMKRLRRRGLALFGPASTSQRLSSVYYDTPKHALRKEGLTLRIRSAGDRYVQTVKAGGETGAGMFDRPEWESEVQAAEPDLEAVSGTPAGRVLARKGRIGTLEPVFETRVERATWHVEIDGAEIEIALDEGQVLADGSTDPIAELELELKRGTPADLFALARNLGGSVALKIGVLSKSERGYALADATRPTSFKAARLALDRRMSTGEAFQAIGRACIRHFRLNEPGLNEQRAPEALHQARVALRRLRSALSLFGEVIADAQLERIKRRLREVSTWLGDARNLDVYLARVARRDGEGSPAEPGTNDFIARLEAERAAAYDRVIATLASRRFQRLMLDLVEWIECGPWCLTEAPEARARRERLVQEFAQEVLDRRRRKVKRTGRNLTELMPDARHEVRIHAKKLRYASEFFAGLVKGKKNTKRYKAFVAALEQLQSCLGDLNDIQTGHEMVAGLAQGAERSQDEGPPTWLFAAGHVTGEEDERAGALLTCAAKAHRDLVKAKPFWR